MSSIMWIYLRHDSRAGHSIGPYQRLLLQLRRLNGEPVMILLSLIYEHTGQLCRKMKTTLPACNSLIALRIILRATLFQPFSVILIIYSYYTALENPIKYLQEDIRGECLYLRSQI